MLRLLLVATLLAFAVPAALPASAATTPCKPSATVKCPDQKKQVKKQTKKKQQTKTYKGRSEYTAEQRKEFLERARQICIREFGASSRVYRLDYKKGRVWCERPGA